MSSGDRRASCALLTAAVIFMAATVLAIAASPDRPARVDLGGEPGLEGISLFEIPAAGSPDGSKGRAAILIHGFQCNHSMMVPLARSLAASRIRVFLLDLPGHGASPAAYTDAAAMKVARLAVEFVVVRTRLPRDRIALIGHSYGAMVLAPVAAEHPLHPAVFIGPGYRAGLTEYNPRSLTLLTAANDYDFVVDAARQLARDATRGSLRAPGIWRSRNDEAHREWLVVPDTAHVSLIFDNRTHDETVRAVGADLSSPPQDGQQAGITLAGFGMLLAALLLALALAARCRDVGIATERNRPIQAIRLVIVCVYAVGVGAIAARSYPLLAPLKLMEGECIASFVFASGALVLVAGRLAFGCWPVPRRMFALSGVPCGLVASALLYVSAMVVVSPTAYHVTFGRPWSGRPLAAAVMATAFYPFFAVGEHVATSAEATPGLAAMRRLILSWSCRLALPLAVTASLSLLSPRLERFTLAVLGLGMFCSVSGALISRLSRNPAAGASFASAVSAWVIAVGFIRY